MNALTNFLVFALTLAGMEGVAWFAHKYVMHGWGWRWHRSHHQPTGGRFEMNDLYALVFASLAILLIALGTSGYHPLEWIGAGMTAYGFLYFLAHDGLVHQRWPFRYIPRRGYLKRLYQAHRLHHAVREQDGCVSFGFLLVPPIAKLKQELKTLQQGRAVDRPGNKERRLKPGAPKVAVGVEMQTRHGN